MRKSYFILPVLMLVCMARGAEVIPPAPDRHFNDYAHVTTDATARQLDQELETFERQTSNQIVAAVYPKMQSGSSVDDYCIRTFNAWQVGQRGKNNGAVLFVFVNDRKMFIVTGYGLEGALPDATCKLIIENDIKPHFKAGDFNAGMTAGLEAMMAATRGEYKGTGRIAQVNPARNPNAVSLWQAVAIAIAATLFPLVYAIIFFRIDRSPRRRSGNGTLSTWSGRDWSGGGGGGGGGGFSGGGGQSGGGGAGGSW